MTGYTLIEPCAGTDGAECAVFWFDKEHDGPPAIEWLDWDPERELEFHGQGVLFDDLRQLTAGRDAQMLLGAG